MLVKCETKETFCFAQQRMPFSIKPFNSGLKYEFRIKARCTHTSIDYQDHTTCNQMTYCNLIIPGFLVQCTYLINKNNGRDLTAMKECNVNYMKLFKSEEQEITRDHDDSKYTCIKGEISAQCSYQLILLFFQNFGQSERGSNKTKCILQVGNSFLCNLKPLIKPETF